MIEYDGLSAHLIEALADVRAQTADELRAELNEVGWDELLMTSHEVVAILVTLQPITGIDPTNPKVLKDCNAQSLGALRTLTAGRKAQ